MTEACAYTVDVVSPQFPCGAAWLAGLGCGWYTGLDELAVQWHRQADFAPQMAADRRDGLYAGWRAAVERTLSGGMSG